MTDHGLADPGPTARLYDGSSPQPVTITVPSPDWQGLLICHGDNTISRLDDDGGGLWSGEALGPVQRAVLAARLRAWADVIDPRPLPVIHNPGPGQGLTLDGHVPFTGYEARL